jgi:enoyl-CoA hydratase
MTPTWTEHYRALAFSRRGKILTITLNNPDQLNAVGKQMHDELDRVFVDAAGDEGSDVVVLTGAGRAFSAGGDISRMQEIVADPDLFFREAEVAKRVVFSLLDLEKPIIAKINGHAVGLGATLALMCDVSFMARDAKIGDPHVRIGLAAGDGGAVIWPHLIGFARAKEYLMTGDLLDAARACEIGLINHAVERDQLDDAVDAFCDRLACGSKDAIRWTKVAVNLELKRIAHSVMEVGMAYETITARSSDHAKAVTDFISKRRRT